MKFEEILPRLKSGHRITRELYHPFVVFYLVPANSYQVQTDAAKACVKTDKTIKYESYIACYNNERGSVAIEPFGTDDILAEDWIDLDEQTL